jgi:hypothetical protein
LNSKLPPPPPEDDDRERKWIVEGLRQALSRASAAELAGLISLLEPVADGDGNVAGWVMTLVADEMGRQFVPCEPDADVTRLPRSTVTERGPTVTRPPACCGAAAAVAAGS